MKVLLALLLIAAGGAAYYYFVYAPRHRVRGEIAYVLPRSLAVLDTPAEVRRVIDTLKNGDRVEVLGRTTNLARVCLADGRIGWVEGKGLLDVAIHERGEQLLKGLESSPAQAFGHTMSVANLHLEPSRDATQLAQLPPNQRVEVFERRLAERAPQAGSQARSVAVRDAWYLVRADSQAGWILGRLVELDVPEGISMYAQGVNLVAWQVLKTINDGAREVRQYLVADRIGTQDVDFNRIRVFTWWTKHHQYVTAYVEGNVNGYFPIRVTHMLDTAYFKERSPYFRLRLVDSDGHRFQKIYGIFDTIVRPLGTVDGWEGDSMPTQPVAKSRRGRSKLRGERRRVSYLRRRH